VWARCFDNSLKGTSSEERGKGKRRVAAQICLPGKWSLVLRNKLNKTELLHFFLAEKITKHNLKKISNEHMARMYCTI
jgi:hypothetical protein